MTFSSFLDVLDKKQESDSLAAPKNIRIFAQPPAARMTMLAVESEKQPSSKCLYITKYSNG